MTALSPSCVTVSGSTFVLSTVSGSSCGNSVTGPAQESSSSIRRPCNLFNLGEWNDPLEKEVLYILARRIAQSLRLAVAQPSAPLKLTALNSAIHSVIISLEKKRQIDCNKLPDDIEVNCAVKTAFALLLIDQDPNGSNLCGIKQVIETESRELSPAQKKVFCSVFLMNLEETLDRHLLTQAALKKELKQQLWFVILCDFHDFSQSIHPKVAASVAKIRDSFSSIQNISESFIRKIQAEVMASAKHKINYQTF